MPFFALPVQRLLLEDMDILSGFWPSFAMFIGRLEVFHHYIDREAVPRTGDSRRVRKSAFVRRLSTV